MSKEVSLNVIIDEKGNIHVEPTGTSGPECINLMAFLDRIKGLNVIETIHNDDMKTKKVQRTSQQKLS